MTLGKVAKLFGVSNYMVKTWIEKGFLNTTTTVVNDEVTEYNITEESVQYVKELRDSYVGIHDYIMEQFADTKTIFDISNTSDRYQLYAALKASPLAGRMKQKDDFPATKNKSNVFYFRKKDEGAVYEWLKDFFFGYGHAPERLQLRMKDDYWKKHPQTYKAVHRYITGKDATAVVMTVEGLIRTVYHEFTDAELNELTALITYVNKHGTDKNMMTLAQFFNFMQSNYKCKTVMRLPKTRSSACTDVNVNTSPYSFSQYMGGAYICFNQTYINENHLVELAVSNYKYAMMWLHMVFGYIAAWRTSDIYQLPVLCLPYDKDITRNLILNETFDSEAVKLSLVLENEINCRHMRPQKTADRQKNFELVVHFDDTLRPVIGMVYAICLLHTTGEHFQKVNTVAKDYVEFFGTKYYEVFENNTFLNRRSNKAYLDAIADITERRNDTHNKALGYAVASYARSHVHEPEELSRMTEVYLQTKLDGLNVNQVLMNLFETGSCSFVSEMMLELVYKEKFSSLLLNDRTKIMNEFDVPAYQLELATKAISKNYVVAKQTITSLCRNLSATDVSDLFTKAIINVAGNTAKSKVRGMDCLCIALRGNCPYKKNNECFGCQYSLPQMGVFYHGLSLIEIEKNAYDAATTSGEKKKHELMLNEVYLPAMLGLLGAMKHKGVDISVFKQEVQNVLKGESEC